MPDEILVSLESIGDDSSIDLENAKTILSYRELDKANAFHFAKHQNRYIRGRYLLRQKLSALLDSDPGGLIIKEEQRGKPFLPNAGLAFNLSHSEDVAIFAFSFSLQRVGIDIELSSRDADIIGLAKHYFSENECHTVTKLEGLEQRDAFFKIWTAKEARMKLTGEGLHLDPRDIEVIFEANTPSGYIKPLPAKQYLKVCQHEQYRAISSVVADREFQIKALDAFGN